MAKKLGFQNKLADEVSSLSRCSVQLIQVCHILGSRSNSEVVQIIREV